MQTIAAFRSQDVPVHVTVVDNGSPAEMIEHVRAAGRPEVVITCGENIGFGPAANVGMARWLAEGAGEWIAVAPHDALPAHDCLSRLLAAGAEHLDVGLLSADVGDGMSPVVDPYFGGMTVAARGGDGYEDVDYPHGTLFLARRRCLAEIGLFDERFFSYCEEADLGIRARRAGWRVGLVRGARVVNPTMGPGVPARDYLQLRNTLVLVRKWSGRYHAGIRLLLAVGQLVDGQLRPARRPPLWSPRGRLLGMWDFLRGRTGPPRSSLLRGSPG